MKIFTHKFEGFDKIPNLDHLKKIENSFVDGFTGNNVNIAYVSYIVDDDNVVAFGSGSYYIETRNYYENPDGEDSDYENTDNEAYMIKERSKQLWIEGMVSIKKGCGRIILRELERTLIQLAHELNVKYKVINLMSVENSVGFYESCGYVECKTVSYWRGQCLTRCAKAFNSDHVSILDVINYDDKYVLNDDCALYSFLASGRRKMCDLYLNIPNEVSHNDLLKYVLDNRDSENLFRSIIDLPTQQKLIKWIIEWNEGMQ